MDFQGLLQLALGNGLWAALFVYLFVYMIKKNDAREKQMIEQNNAREKALNDQNNAREEKFIEQINLWNQTLSKLATQLAKTNTMSENNSFKLDKLVITQEKNNTIVEDNSNHLKDVLNVVSNCKVHNRTS